MEKDVTLSCMVPRPNLVWEWVQSRRCGSTTLCNVACGIKLFCCTLAQFITVHSLLAHTGGATVRIPIDAHLQVEFLQNPGEQAGKPPTVQAVNQTSCLFEAAYKGDIVMQQESAVQ